MVTHRALRVLRADRGGSSWPVVIETDAGVFHTKLRGAGQAPASLIAEIIVGALADTLGLNVPGRVLIDLPPGVHVDDPHEELAQLLQMSVGVNLGFQYLANVRSFQPSDVPRVDEALASRIVWLDGLVQNPDRTEKNPNLLWSHEALWLIDHGASLGFHHAWPRVTEASPRAHGWQIGSHVLRSRATRLPLVDAALAAQLNREALESAVDAVPDEFLARDDRDATRRRAAYVAFLWKRLKGPRPFIAAPQPAAVDPDGNTPQIRRATPADADAIAAAHADSIRSIGPAFYPAEVVEAWGAGLTRDLYIRAMEDGEAFFVAMGTINGETSVLGFSTHRVDDNQDGTSVYVRGLAARQGIGTALLRLAEAHARAHGAKTIQIQASLAGVEFYKANGFEEVARGEAWLMSGRPMPCVSMRKTLKG